MSSSNFEDYSNIQIGNETFNFAGGVVDADGKSPVAAVLDVISKTSVTRSMGSLERLVSESYKFIRLADDINDMKNYINDMRVCFVALTISGYVAVLIYAIVVLCSKRSGRRGRRLRHSSPSGVNYDEEAMGWAEKPVLSVVPHQAGSVGGGGGAGVVGGRTAPAAADNRDAYHYRSSGRRSMQPFSRQRYNVAAAMSDMSERQASGDLDPNKVNGPLETYPLTQAESVAASTVDTDDFRAATAAVH